MPVPRFDLERIPTVSRFVIGAKRAGRDPTSLSIQAGTAAKHAALVASCRAGT
jgi:hypothetical protein